jgi:hypothetical protein
VLEDLRVVVDWTLRFRGGGETGASSANLRLLELEELAILAKKVSILFFNKDARTDWI